MHMVWLGLECFFGGALFLSREDLSSLECRQTCQPNTSRVNSLRCSLQLTSYPSKKCADHCECHGSNEGKRSVMRVYG